TRAFAMEVRLFWKRQYSASLVIYQSLAYPGALRCTTLRQRAEGSAIIPRNACFSTGDDQ
ncbi:MAG TPA: hypothetical protein VK642_11585, partial [Burkholderiales bacterium]|nr:hypothetical protein [Burkholderiales bacterium]